MRRTESSQWHAAAIHAYLHALRSGLRAETVGTDNVRSLAMVFAAIESAEIHRRVAIAALRNTA